MFGDGHIRNPNAHKRSTGNCRLEFTFKASVQEFTQWIKFDVLGGDLKTMPSGFPRENPTQFCRCKPLFTKLANVIDPQGNRIKVIPSNEFLKEHFTEVALAFLIMSDGYWDNDQKTVLICTENKTKQNFAPNPPYIFYEGGIRCHKEEA